MADRTAAGIFATVFVVLAKNPTPDHKRIARKLWAETFEYDFNACQLECDDELIRLGLARKTKDAEGDNTVQYRERNARTWESL